MDLTFRLPGPWGSGKGANLQPTEVDNNFWALAEAILDLQSNPAQPVGITSISVSGTQMTITLTDGTVMGPFTLPVLTFRWRGEYEAGASYAELDVFTVTNGNPWIADTSTVRYGIFMVQVSIPAAPMFDPDLQIGGVPAFLQLFGSVDTLLSTLADVAVDEPPGFNPLAEGHVLRWTFDTERWVNSYLGSMAVQDANNVHIVGGSITGLPAPLLPGDAVTKAYVDALPAGMMVADRTMMANISGLTGPALANTLSDFLDYALLTSARGTLLYRAAAGWTALAPGTSGYFLKTLGAGADPAWAVGGSGVTSVAAGTGITTGAGPITATGSVALAAVADNSILANVSGSSAAPAAATLTALLDHVASSTRGSILMRAGSGWVALAPGTSGYYLQTQGGAADAVWSSPSGSGTVTSVSAGTGISTGGAPITGAGTVSLAAFATASVLANISGGSAAPVPATVTALFDSVFGSTQGAVLYRNASAWVMLSPGTSGQVLTTAGASANPSWANPAAAAPIANLLLLANISGSTAAPSGNTLSNILDAVLGSSRGMLVYRGASAWTTLGAGTAGQLLQTGGTAGNPSWVTGATGASITTSDTPPGSPADGDAWWDSVSGQLYIRYDDGSSSQWVPASNQPGPAGAAGTNANISGLTAGQIGIAGSATSVTSSIPTTTFVARAGDTMTGNLTITTPGTTSAQVYLNKPTATTANIISGGVAASTRWTIVPGDGSAGDDFAIGRWSDAGAFVGVPLAISRATGNVSFGGALLVGDDAGTTAHLALEGGNVTLRSAGGAGHGTIYLLADSVTQSRNVSHEFLNASAVTLYAKFNSTATYNVSGAWATISSIAVKEQIEPYKRGLEAILELNPVQFRYSAGTPFAEADKPSRVLFGLIAEEVAPHVPEIVGETTMAVRGEQQTIETLEPGNLVYALINSVKTLASSVDALTAKVQALEAAK